MIYESVPNNQNRFKLIVSLFSCLLLVVIIFFGYVKARNWVTIEWLSEIVLFLVLGAITWLYRVSNSWRFEINGCQIYVQLYYNFFLWGKVVVAGGSGHKVYPCRASKNVNFFYNIQGKNYLFDIKKARCGNFFCCSIQESEEST